MSEQRWHKYPEEPPPDRDWYQVLTVYKQPHGANHTWLTFSFAEDGIFKFSGDMKSQHAPPHFWAEIVHPPLPSRDELNAVAVPYTESADANA